MSLLALAVGPCLFDNPLVARATVGGTPLFNALLYAYGLPALLLGGLAYLVLRTPTVEPAAAGNGAKTAGIAALTLTFILVSLEVRQAYAGSVLLLRETPISQAEWYSYSVAWVIFGVVLLVLGVRMASTALRYASLAVMLLTVAKVFAFDIARLDDLYRVLSFVGLGLSLLGLGYVYQRFVFHRAEPPS